MMSVDQLVSGYSSLAAVVRPVNVDRIAPDPDDDVVIGTALAASAERVVTGDHGLLSIGAYRGVQIISVSEMLAILDLAPC